MKRWALIYKIYLEGIKGTFEDVLEDFDKGIKEVVSAVLNLSLIDLVNAVLGIITGWVGRILTIPDVGLREVTLEAVRETGKANRLIRLDDAVRGVFGAYITTIGTWTTTGKNELHDVVVTWMARFSWTLFKRVKFVLKAIKVTSEADLIKLYLDSWLGRIKLLRGIGIVIGIIAAVLKIGTILTAFSLIQSIEELTDRVLPQDSRRIRHRTYHRSRVNLRRGADTAHVTQ